MSMIDRLAFDILERSISKLKGREFVLDRSVPFGLLVGIVLRRVSWLIRGVVKCLILQREFRFVFMAPKVNLRNAALIRFGKDVTLDRGAIIDGLSHDGIEFGSNVMIGPYSMVRASVVSNL